MHLSQHTPPEVRFHGQLSDHVLTEIYAKKI